MRKSALLLPLTLLLGCGPSTPEPTAQPASSASAPAASRATDTFATSKGEIKVTPLFHATTLLEIGGKAIHVDPFSKADFTGLPKADFVVITDVHMDHFDPKALEQVEKADTKFVVPPAVAEKLKGKANVVALKNGDKQDLGLFTVEAVPMYNLERGPEKGKLFHDKGRGNGYVLGFGDKRFYFSGDTECTPEMKALASIDVAFVCMNLPYTMPPKEAAVCVNAFKPKVLFPYHYGSPGGESSNLDELKSAIDPKAGVEVRVRKWY
jgi:L-ascorbate metabolism protein UlaG (beta-lactamase superfamily)